MAIDIIIPATVFCIGSSIIFVNKEHCKLALGLQHARSVALDTGVLASSGSFPRLQEDSSLLVFIKTLTGFL